MYIIVPYISALHVCRRCQQLSNGEMVPAVADAWAKRQGVGGNRLPLVSPEELRGQLTQIREKAALVQP